MTDDTDAIDQRTIWVRSMVSARNWQPYVSLAMADGSMAQLSPEQAREIGNNLIGAAEAAEQDAWLVSFGRETMDLSDKEAAVLLAQYREWRERRAGISGDSDPEAPA